MFPARIELAHLVPETSALSTELRELLFNHNINDDCCEVCYFLWGGRPIVAASVEREHGDRKGSPLLYTEEQWLVYSSGGPCARHAKK